MTEDGMNGRRAAALITLLAVAAMATGCADDGAGADAATATTLQVGMEPELPTADTTRDDDFDHVIAITINSPTLDPPDTVNTFDGQDGVLGPDGSVIESEDDDRTVTGGAVGPDGSVGPSDVDDVAPVDTTPRVPSTLPVSTVPAATINGATIDGATIDGATMDATAIEVASMSMTAAPPEVDPRRSTELQVERLDGAVERVRVPDGSLPTARLLTAAESDLLDSFADQPLAVLVHDVSGVVGAVGRRYVMVPGRLIEVGAATAPATTSPGASTPETTAPAAPAPPATTTTTVPPTTEPPVLFGPPTDEEILTAIRELSGLVAADIVAPGLIAVVTSGRRDDLLGIDGVVGVETDTLFDLAADPDQDLQWMLANNGAPEQAGGWPGVPAPTTPTTPPSLGNLTLATRPTTGALSTLSATSWPTAGCRRSTCAATSL